MKSIIIATIILSTTACAFPVEMVREMQHGAQVKAFLQVLDQEGKPVQNAFVSVGFLGQYNKQTNLKGKTNVEGVFRVEGECTALLGCTIVKEGFYGHRFMWEFPRPNIYPPIADGKWQPYGETNVVVLKKIMNPVKLLQPEVRLNRRFPLGEWHGYDLAANEWLPPWGNGSHPDMLVKLTHEERVKRKDLKYSMEICFTNNPLGGIVFAKKDMASEMKSLYKADTNNVYAQWASFVYERHPGTRAIDTRLDDHSYLVFRTRTEVDAEGELVSAYYGKIYGPWEFFGGMRAASVQFNPNRNDPNLEDAETARLARLSLSNFMESFVEEQPCQPLSSQPDTQRHEP